MVITIKHGFDTVNREFDRTPTVGDLRRDTGLRVELGFREGDRALVNGVEQPDDAYLAHGTTVLFETRANSKAVRAASDPRGVLVSV